MMQYLSALENAGITVQIAPFFDDDYLRSLYSGKHDRARVMGYYLKRVNQLWRLEKPDVIWLEKELLPWVPAGIERAFMPRGVPVVSDYDDAVFHRYDQHRSKIIRSVLGNKIDKVMAHSSLVMAGNTYLATRAREAGAARVEVVPTVVDADAYDVTPLPEADGCPRIGWIGVPSTWAGYIKPKQEMLVELACQHGAMLRLVGAGIDGEGQIESLPWTEASESRLIQGMNIGLMPLDDSLWSRGKCGYKLIQYMACGLPVVASPVGVNVEIVEDGVTGFLASSDAEWRTAIARLLADPPLRRRMGQAGRRRVEERYSLQVWGPKVAEWLLEVASQ